MQDEVYRKTIRSYDLRTLLAASARLDTSAYPQREAWLLHEIEQRTDGVDPEPAEAPSRLNLTRDEGYAGFIYRFPALALDLILIFSLFGWTLDIVISLGEPWLVTVVPWVVPAWFVTTTRALGAPPGKALLGLRVTDQAFRAPGARAILLMNGPVFAIAAVMTVGLCFTLLSGLTLPDHGSVQTRQDTIVTRSLLWSEMHSLWYIWFWSEILFLSLDPYRRALPELISKTLIVHRDNLPTNSPPEYPTPVWLSALVSVAARTRSPGL